MSNDTVIRLKPEFVQAILADEELRAKVAEACEKSSITIYRWCHSNDSRLTMLSALVVIREYMKLGKDAVITHHVKLNTVEA
jgi:hypothetical protein